MDIDHNYNEAIGALVNAMVQLLDDMGKDGQCVCLAAKAQARVAVEFFIVDDEDYVYDALMPLEAAKAILKDLAHG